jgi:hypothetical protein
VIIAQEQVFICPISEKPTIPVSIEQHGLLTWWFCDDPIHVHNGKHFMTRQLRTATLEVLV